MAQVKLRRPWFGPDGVLYDAGVQFVPNDFLSREPEEEEEGEDGKKMKKDKDGKGILPKSAEILSESDKPHVTNAVVGVPIAPKTVSVVAGSSDDEGLITLDQKRPEDPKVKAAVAEKEAAQVNAKK